MKKTLVLIHGWGTSGYNSNLPTKPPEDDAWKTRIKLLSLLRRKYQLLFYNLPGFCGVREPKEKSFDVEDFSDLFHKWLTKNSIVPQAIIGYSFGGAVTLSYKTRYQSKTPIILISPALKRKESFKSHLASLGKRIIPESILKSLKPAYQSLFSRYYHQGTPFLRASYDKIARRDLRPLLSKINPKEILLIFGNSDTATPHTYIKGFGKEKSVCIIKNGDHEIGATHPQEIFKLINNFV